MSSSSASFSSRFPGSNLSFRVSNHLIGDIYNGNVTDITKLEAVNNFTHVVGYAYIDKFGTTDLTLSALRAAFWELGAPFYEKGEAGSFWVTLQSIFQGRTKDRVALELAFVRLNQLHSAQLCADAYLRVMKIAPLEGKTCAEWAVKVDIGAAEKSRDIYDLVEEWQDDLFPPHISAENSEEGRQPKGMLYVSEALFRAGLSVGDAKKKLEELGKVVLKDVAQQARLVKKDPAVREGMEVLRRELRKREGAQGGGESSKGKGKGKKGDKKGKGKGKEKQVEEEEVKEEVTEEEKKEEEEPKKEEREEVDEEMDAIEVTYRREEMGRERRYTGYEWEMFDARKNVRECRFGLSKLLEASSGRRR